MGSIADLSEVLLELGLSDSATNEEKAIASVALTKAEAAIKRHLKYDPVQKTHTEYYPQTNFSQSSRSFLWEVNNTHAYQRQLQEASTDELQLQHLPVRSITSLSIDFDGRAGTKAGAFATTETQGTDYWPNFDSLDSEGNGICKDGIIRSHGRWPSEPGSVKVVYVAGYTQSELHGQDDVLDASDILDAVLSEAVKRVNKLKTRMKRAGVGFIGGAFKKEKLGDYEYEIDSSVLEKYLGSSMDLSGETMDQLSEFVNYGYALAG